MAGDCNRYRAGRLGPSQLFEIKVGLGGNGAGKVRGHRRVGDLGGPPQGIRSPLGYVALEILLHAAGRQRALLAASFSPRPAGIGLATVVDQHHAEQLAIARREPWPLEVDTKIPTGAKRLGDVAALGWW